MVAYQGLIVSLILFDDLRLLCDVGARATETGQRKSHQIQVSNSGLTAIGLKMCARVTGDLQRIGVSVMEGSAIFTDDL